MGLLWVSLVWIQSNKCVLFGLDPVKYMEGQINGRVNLSIWQDLGPGGSERRAVGSQVITLLMVMVVVMMVVVVIIVRIESDGGYDDDDVRGSDCDCDW